MSVLTTIGTQTRENIGESITAIAWEKVGKTAIPFIRKTNGQLLTSKYLLKDVLFKQEFQILKDEIFELMWHPNLHRNHATKLENRLLNEISNEMLNISLTDRPILLVKIEDAFQIYSALKNFYTIITERKFSSPLYGFVFIENKPTPIPFLSVKNVGLVVPTCFFECPQLMPLTFSLTNHWNAVYFKLLFKLLKIRKTFYNNLKVVRLKNLLSSYPVACKSYTVAHQLPSIVDVSEFTVHDDDIIIVENQPDSIEIISSDEDTSGPQEPKKLKLKLSSRKLDEQLVNAGISHEDEKEKAQEKDKHQTTNKTPAIILPRAAISTNQQQLVIEDSVDILDIIPNKDLPDQEYLKLTDNSNSHANLGFHKVHKILATNTQANYSIGIQRFKDVKFEFVCINTKKQEPPSKRVYLINLSEILGIMFPRVKVESFMLNCNKFSLKTFALDKSHINYLLAYYALKNLQPPKDYFYLELRKFCEVYWSLKRSVEE